MKSFILLVVAIIGLFLMSAKPENEQMFSLKLNSKRENIDWENSSKSINYLQNYAEFTPENLRRLVEYLNFPNDSIILKQALLETGHFKENLFTKHRNLFGLHFPNKRKTYASGWYWGDTDKQFKVSHFDKWQHAVFDLKELIDYWDSVYLNKRLKGKEIVLSNEDYEEYLLQINFSSAQKVYIYRLGKTNLWF